MDPEGIGRSVEWKDAQGVIQRDWTTILRQLVEAGTLPVPEHAALVDELEAFGAIVANLPGLAMGCGVEKLVLDQCLASIEAQADQLAKLAA